MESGRRGVQLCSPSCSRAPGPAGKGSVSTHKAVGTMPDLPLCIAAKLAAPWSQQCIMCTKARAQPERDSRPARRTVRHSMRWERTSLGNWLGPCRGLLYSLGSTWRLHKLPTFSSGAVCARDQTRAQAGSSKLRTRCKGPPWCPAPSALQGPASPRPAAAHSRLVLTTTAGRSRIVPQARHKACMLLGQDSLQVCSSGA